MGEPLGLLAAARLTGGAEVEASRGAWKGSGVLKGYILPGRGCAEEETLPAAALPPPVLPRAEATDSDSDSSDSEARRRRRKEQKEKKKSGERRSHGKKSRRSRSRSASGERRRRHKHKRRHGDK